MNRKKKKNYLNILLINHIDKNLVVSLHLNMVNKIVNLNQHQEEMMLKNLMMFYQF